MVSNNPSIITTFNLDFLRIADSDEEFNNICKKSIYNFPDGAGITNLIKLKYNKKIKRITGNDLLPKILELVRNNNLRMVMIGGSNRVTSILKNEIAHQYSIGEDNLLCLAPPYEFELNSSLNMEIIEQINHFKPDITLAALGCPRQEKWLFNNMHNFNSKLNIGMGAAFDYFTGVKRRSPVIMQNHGLEWLWRLMKEPKRLFFRYIVLDIPFFIKTCTKIVIEKLSTKKTNNAYSHK
jgi:N-acetylglucosaminyldiphosphoundecaprenol N-acetyl-beta-D-mannosaminyltransferase